MWCLGYEPFAEGPLLCSPQNWACVYSIPVGILVLFLHYHRAEESHAANPKELGWDPKYVVFTKAFMTP